MIGLALVIAYSPTVGADPVGIAGPRPAVPAQQNSDCHPNYSGACVPIARDVDCAGGNGNGPEYVQGPVYVIGEDVYELDREGDGVACEPTRR